MQRLLPSVLFTALVTSLGLAQNQPPNPIPAPASVLTEFGSMAGTLQDLQVPSAPTQAFTVDVVLGEGVYHLRLHAHDVRTPDFQLLVDDGLSIRQVPTPPSVTWRGDVEGVPTSAVAASVIQGDLQATVSLSPEGGTWGIQALREVDPSAPVGRYFVYHSSDNANTAHRCGVADPTSPLPAPTGIDPSVILECEIGIDADFDYFRNRGGSSVTGTQNSVTTIMNSVDVIYLRDVEIKYQITAILVRTSSATNPYTSNNAGTLLNQFANEWFSRQGSIRRDVAHLFTGRNTGGVLGVAILSGICSLTRGYGMSQHVFTTNLTRRVGVVAHELGHNWSAQHCDPVSDCRIMCSGLGGCSQNLSSFAPVSISSILNHKNSRTCLSPLVRMPTISLVFPGTVRAFQPPAVTLTGLGFNGVTSIQLGTATITTGFTVVNDNTITFSPPTASALGSVPLSVTNSAGTSNSSSLTYGATIPPVLEAPGGAVNGFPLHTSFGGQPNHLYVLVAALGSGTNLVQGFPVLQSPTILKIGTLDPVGLGSFTLQIPMTGGFTPLQVWSQLVEGDAMNLQLTGVSNIESTLILL